MRFLLTTMVAAWGCATDWSESDGEIDETGADPASADPRESVPPTSSPRMDIASQADAAPTWIYPSMDDQVIDLFNPFQWETGAAASWLLIGTTPGADDLLYGGQTARADYYYPSLPLDQTLHARVWTYDAEQWQNSDIRFQVGSRPVAAFTHPTDGATDVDLNIPFSWDEIPGAETYYLKIGTEPGSSDLLDTGELSPTSLSRDVVDLPPMRTLYAQIWTRRAGMWAHEDITFAVSRTRLAELYRPLPGAVLPAGGFRFAWSAVTDASGYLLRIGTCRGCRDVADSGVLRDTEWSTPHLPIGVALYARIFTRVGSKWSHRDSVFSAGAPLPAATIQRPASGQRNFRASTPFSWPEIPTAMSYRLQIGTTAGASDVHDSGPIHVNRRLIAGLPAGVPLFGTLGTQSDGSWLTTSFTFSVVSSVVSSQAQIALSEWLTVRSRLMATMAHDVLQGTTLHALTREVGHARAGCLDYARNLVSLLADAGIGLQARTLNVAFNSNAHDSHVAVELLDPATETWFVLDPTFMLTIQRISNGARMSPDEISAMVRQHRFGEIGYRFLAPAGRTLARQYALDYPLHYLNVLRGQPLTFTPVTPYMTDASLPLPGVPALGYTIQCTRGETAVVELDGVETSLSCDGAESTSRVFAFAAIEAVSDPSGYRLFEVNRYQF